MADYYIEFPDSNVTWHFERIDINFFSGTSYYYYSISMCGDTSMNGQTYKILSSGTDVCDATDYEGAFREDTLNRLVYYVPPSMSEEQLLYDFNMQTGDTVKGYIETKAYQPDIVQAIDSVLIGSKYRKRWLINPDYSIYIIEGIGSTYGLYEFSPGDATDHSNYFLFCYQQNDHTLYPDTTSDCKYPNSIIPDQELHDQVKVFPNPCKGSITVESENILLKEIYLLNMLGQVIFTKKTNIRRLTQIDNLHQGIYILNIRDKSNRVSNQIVISSP
jgi:hypothetical protein